MITVEQTGRHRRQQSGFSIVELLMAAFILAIGILGLTMLQTMSVRSTTGAKGLTTAVLVAEQVMDEIEADGRNSLLYARSTPPVTPSADLKDFFTMASAPITGTPSRTYNFAGRISASDVLDSNPYFSVFIQPNVAAGGGVVAPVPGLGGIAEMTVVVRWSEVSNVFRQVTISRRVAYATTCPAI